MRVLPPPDSLHPPLTPRLLLPPRLPDATSAYTSPQGTSGVRGRGYRRVPARTLETPATTLWAADSRNHSGDIPPARPAPRHISVRCTLAGSCACPAQPSAPVSPRRQRRPPASPVTVPAPRVVAAH